MVRHWGRLVARGILIVGTMLSAGCFDEPVGLGIVHIDHIEISRVSDLVLEISYVMYNLAETGAYAISLHFEAYVYADEATAKRGMPLDQLHDARVVFDQPLPGRTQRTINHTMNLSNATTGWSYLQQGLRVEYNYNPGGLPAAIYRSPCMSREMTDHREYCQAFYSMWRTNIRDPLPGSPYWQEQLRSAGFEPDEPTA